MAQESWCMLILERVHFKTKHFTRDKRDIYKSKEDQFIRKT